MSKKAYGCYNRPAFRTVFPAQDGWWIDGSIRVAKLASVPFRMEFECQYRKTDLGKADEKCVGCSWKK